MKENESGYFGKLSVMYREYKKKRTAKKFYKSLRKAKRLNLYPAIILKQHDLDIELMNPDESFKSGYAWDRDTYTNANIFRKGYANSLKFNFSQLKVDESMYNVDDLTEKEIEEKLEKIKDDNPEIKDKIDEILEKGEYQSVKNIIRNKAKKYSYDVIPSQKYSSFMENHLITEIIKEGDESIDVKRWILIVLGFNSFLIFILMLMSGGV